MVDKTPAADDCDDVRAYHTHYKVAEAAALWCEVPVSQVEKVLKECSPEGRGIFSHPSIPCIAPRCRAIHDAIEHGALECRRDGRVVGPNEHVAPERRTVAREALKVWIANHFPARKPTFLFDEVERSTHGALSVEAYQNLKAQLDSKIHAFEKASERIRELTSTNQQMESELVSLRAIVDRANSPGERSEATYLRIIGMLLALLLGKTPSGKPNSVFKSQAAVIDALEAHNEGKARLSRRTLEDKFAEANRHVAAS